jgi:hypothetical protein
MQVKACHYFVDVEGIGIGGDVNVEVIGLGFRNIYIQTLPTFDTSLPCDRQTW